MKVAIIGDGGWGTCLSLLAQRTIQVTVWGAFPEYIEQLRLSRENIKFLPGVKIPARIAFTGDLSVALRGAGLVILAVPSVHLRGVLGRMRPLLLGVTDVLSVVKGLEHHTQLRMSQVIREELGPKARIAVLSGPNIAGEIARHIPAAAVCACPHAGLARKVQDLLMQPWFRIYTHADLIGVEMGGALKNIIAIACGISDGLGFGTNTKAALITRGLTEMARFGTAQGAHAATFYGLSGLGDVVTTAMSSSSRNRWLGEQLAKGRDLTRLLASTEMVIEGVSTTRAAAAMARSQGIDMPITTEVYRVLFQKKKPLAAVAALMERTRKREI